MASYLLQETGYRLVLEDGTGDLVLEISVPTVPSSGGDGDPWADAYMAAELLRDVKPTRKRVKVADDADETDVIVENGRVTFTAANAILDHEAELQAVLAMLVSV